MRRFLIPFALVSAVTLGACQTTDSNTTSRGSATFCDKFVAWEAMGSDGKADRAVTKAEVCAKPAGNDVWMKVTRVHSKLQGRQYWLLLPIDDPHLAAASSDTAPVLSGWTLQARPFKWAHEIVAVRDKAALASTALLAEQCPRKAVGKKRGQRYCIATP